MNEGGSEERTFWWIAIEALVAWFSSLSWAAQVLAGCALIGVIAVPNWWARPDFDFAIFYLIPIAIVAWCGGRFPGLIVAVLASAAWFLVDELPRPITHPLVPVWNVAVRLAVFFLAVLLLAKLRTALAHERELARTDPLTGAANHRTFYENVELEIRRAQRTGRPFTAAYIDLDNFKLVNDCFGHQTGDTILCQVVRILADHVRATDTVARLGGDEFALLLPETDPAGAQTTIDKLLDRLLDAMVLRDSPVTFSVGAVTFQETPKDAGDVVRQIDEAMYSVKRTGKNRIQYEVR